MQNLLNSELDVEECDATEDPMKNFSPVPKNYFYSY